MGEKLRFKVLGPLGVVAGGTAIALGSPRQRTILGMLLINPGHVVSVDAMVEAVWSRNPPRTARTQVAICVAALRKSVKNAGVDEDVIITAHPGYVVSVEGHSFDSLEFAELVQAADRHSRASRLAESAQCYGQALELWTGPAFAGVSGPEVEDEAARLEDYRLNVHEESTLVQLQLGKHLELLPELTATVRDNPLRERPRHHLMLAQYRSGRRADALETYRDARSRFIEELGIEPGPELKELHDAILRDEPSLLGSTAAIPERTPVPVTAPSELPPDVLSFVGRAEELAALDGLVEGAPDGPGSTCGLITGPVGSGKSGLAMRWASRVAERFPDGRLFVDLRGYDGQHDPACAADVLSRFLRSLGVPGEQLPEGCAERSALFRGLLAERRLLIVLDNAHSHAQISPLLPGGSSCVLVTSRFQMEDFVARPPQARVHLGPLSAAEAMDLLTAIVGERRIATARADASRLVELCDRMPMALRIAAARLASKPHWTVRYLVARLSDERHRLDELSQGESQIRASFELSYRFLSGASAALLRRLGLLDAPDFTAWVGAALLDIDEHDADGLIEGLVDAQFVEVVGVDATGRLRYRLHGLVRLYARERAVQEDDETEQVDACSRYLRTFMAIAREADRREDAGGGTGVHSEVPGRPVDPDLLDELLAVPLEWFEAERLSLVAAVRQAARLGLAALAWDLTVCASLFFGIRSYTDDWRQCCEDALRAARAAGDLRGEGAMLYGLGALEIGHSQVQDAVAYFEQSLEHYDRSGEEHGSAMALRSLGQADRMCGDLDTAMARFARALPIFREVGDRYCEAHTLSNMAETELDAGRPEAAMAFAVEAVALEEGRGADTRNLAQSLYRLGRVYGALGRWDEAEEVFLRAVRIVKEKADMVGLAHTLLGLGETRLGQGHPELAEATLQDALEIAEESRSPMAAGRINLVLAEVSRLLERPEAARKQAYAAKEWFAVIGASAWEQRAERALESLVG